MTITRCKRASNRSKKATLPKEQPMWTDTGAVDYSGRALFQEWNKLKGKTKDQAKEAFVYAYGRALSEQRHQLNFRKY